MRTYFLLILFLSLSWLPSQAQDKPFPNSAFLTVDELSLHHRQWKQPDSLRRGYVLLVHGFCGSTFSWRNTVPALLEQGYEVLAVDVPPFGYSDRATRVNHAPSYQAKLLWGLIKQLYPADEPKWHVVGHSMGASIVGAMTSARPAKVRGLILVDGTITYVEDGLEGWREMLVRSRIAKGGAEIAGRLYFFHYGRIKKILTTAYSQEPDSAAIVGYLEPLKIKKTASGIFDLTGYSEDIFPFSYLDIKQPVLMIWGEKDQWIPIGQGKKQAEKMETADLVVLPGAGHCPMETHGDTFNRFVLSWLKAYP
ncbi:MAG: alpha/beta hydrolase [Bacteroidota bacterium]